MLRLALQTSSEAGIVENRHTNQVREWVLCGPCKLLCVLRERGRSTDGEKRSHRDHCVSQRLRYRHGGASQTRYHVGV